MATARQYPHVDDITDWRAKQSLRLLWDRVFDLETRLQASEHTTGDLVLRSDAQDDHLASLQTVAGEALSAALFTRSQIIAGGGGPGGGGTPTNVIVAMSSDPVQIEIDINASLAWYIANLGGASNSDVAYWMDKAGHPEVFSNGKWHLGWNKYWEDRMHPANTGSADPAGGALSAVHT